MKKFTLITVLFILISNFAVAQQRTVERHFKVKSTQKIDLNLKFGDSITVKSWPKNEVSFKAVFKINQGKLNDALTFNFDNENRQLSVKADYDKEKLKMAHSGDCSGHGYSEYSVSGGHENYRVCAHIIYQVFVPHNAHLNVKSIDANLTLVNLVGPVQAKSISGFVDLSWPVEAPAHFSLKTISGETFTDLDELKVTGKGEHIPVIGRKIKARLGNGGPAVSLKSISGNIYLRKVHS